MILRVNDTSLVSRKFFATCWVMVEAPCGRRLVPKFCSIEHAGARHAGEVDAAMLVEILVFGGEERVDHQLRHRLDRQIEPALLGVFGEQRAVGGVHARHHRRLVILQLRIVRQVLRVMPDQPGDARRRRPGTRSFRRRTGSPETAPAGASSKFRFNPVRRIGGDVLTTTRTERSPLRGRTINGPADNLDRFRRPCVLFYTAVAVAKLGLEPHGTLFSRLSRCGRDFIGRPDHAAWRRNASIACATEPTVL